MSDSKATIWFHGGAGSVTGSNFLLDTGEEKILVDCGLEQGARQKVDPNSAPFAYDPKSVDLLLITHAHIDHIGRVPKLVRDGFSGPIYSTPATKEIAALMFDDALSIMADEERKYGTVPLYARVDANRALELWKTHEYHEEWKIGKSISVRFLDSGHVLGSAMIALTRFLRTIVFTGDLGNTPAPLLRETEVLSGVNYMVMESVYGDRLHEGRDERREALRNMIRTAVQRGGTLLIPAFSLQRTQIMLYEINTMLAEVEIDPIDIYLDSPLASRIMEVYRNHTDYFNDVARERASKGDLFTFPGLSVVDSSQESKKIMKAPNPKIIIAGSGMSHGGRIQGHEKHFLDQKDTTILFVGYQAAGALGRRIQEGQKRVRIDKEWVNVRAHIETLRGYSAHADRDALMKVVENTADSLTRVFVAMGEPRSSLFLAQRLRDFLGVDAISPKEGDSYTIEW